MKLLPGMCVFERGWLSSNNILFTGDKPALVDSGYFSHAGQTLDLVQRTLGTRELQVLVNTHLHSDHCGGNAALQEHYNGVRTLVPPGQFGDVVRWDTEALTYGPTGQHCPPFGVDGVLEPGGLLQLGDDPWEVHAAPGHDPHAVMLFHPGSQILISADALWETGFGVVFPELEGDDAFGQVAATLDVIEALGPAVVVPGHGRPFDTVSTALQAARRRLDGFVSDPRKHARHAGKVLIKFKLLELQSISLEAFESWTAQTAYFAMVHARWGEGTQREWVRALLEELVMSGNATLKSDLVRNA